MIKSIITNQKSIRIIYILILTLTFIKVYSAIFDEKISLVGDNVSYYILGNALADGEGYTNIQHLEKEPHYHYPPGYPMLIAGTIKLFSSNTTTIKIANGVFLLGAIVLLFFIIKRLTENNHIAFATCFITLLNYHILSYAMIMMSEIPFLFFSMLCLWLFLKVDFSKPVYKNGIFFLLIICLSFSFYIRSIALALFASFAAFLLLKKYWKYLATLIGGFVLLYLPWIIRGKSSSGNTYVSQVSLKNPYEPELGTVGFSDILERIFINLERYITKEIPSSILHTNDVVYTEATASIVAWFLGLIIIVLIGFGLVRLQKFRIFILLYLLAFFSLLLLWPSVWYGTRFILPLLPIILCLLIYAIKEILTLLSVVTFPKNASYATFGFMVLLLGIWSFWYGSASISKLQTQAEGIYINNYQNYFTLAKWIQENAPDDAVTAVRKEGLFYLFSKKNVTNYLKTHDKEAHLEYLKRKKVKYVVVDQLGFSSTSAYLVPLIDTYPNKFKLVKELKNPNTYLMEFHPELGYTGTWKNGKRNGLGTYLWEDGQKYVGEWKDDLRHGKGTVYFTDDTYIEGVWENGKLEGEVLKKSKDGSVLERSSYSNNIKVKIIDETN